MRATNGKTKWKMETALSRGVHSGDRVGFGRVSYGSVAFRIGYFSAVCYNGSQSG